MAYTLKPGPACSELFDPSVAGPNQHNYGKIRAANQSYCGWYTTLIEDRTVGAANATTGIYPNNVRISYETRAGFEHAISQVTDSAGRVIRFHNCEWGAGLNPADVDLDIGAGLPVHRTAYYPPSPGISRSQPCLVTSRFARLGLLSHLATLGPNCLQLFASGAEAYAAGPAAFGRPTRSSLNEDVLVESAS